MRLKLTTVALIALAVLVSACGKKAQPVPIPQPPPPAVNNTPPPSAPPLTQPPQRVTEDLPVPPQPVAGDDSLSNRPLDEINQNSPLKPAFFTLDNADLDDAAKAVVSANADILRKYPTWMVTVEGHCDERGTAEYNLALGERRAVAVKTYLVSLGISPDRLRTVSYGKEFPFDPGHTEDSWKNNRRAQFVITAK